MHTNYQREDDVSIGCRNVLSYKNLGQQKLYKNSTKHFKIRKIYLGDYFKNYIYLNFNTNPLSELEKFTDNL